MSADTPKPPERKERAYILTEASRGNTIYLVYGRTAKEARQRFEDGDYGEQLDSGHEPHHIASVRREPNEDPS